MNTSTNSKTRDRLLQAGFKEMLFRGYQGVSVRDIVDEAQTAQGSFTNHFRSKERFTGEVLDLYFEHIKELMNQAFDDTGLTSREKLLRYLDIISGRLAQDNFRRGCLIGDLSAEIPAQSEFLRIQLNELYHEWRIPFAACIADAQAKGEIASDFEAEDLAEFLLASWEGAILRAKVCRDERPLEIFKKIAFNKVFNK